MTPTVTELPRNRIGTVATPAAPAKLKTICQLLHGLTVGGAEVLAARIARQLGERYRFVFACLDEIGPLGEQLRADGFAVWCLGRKPGVDVAGMWRLAKFLRGEQVELIHAHQYTPFFYGITARLFYRRPPVLFTEHGRWFPDYPRRKRIVANRLLLERRDRVVAVGEQVRQALVHNEGMRPERVGVIYNGVDLERFALNSATRGEVRREIGVGSDDLFVVQVARLDGLKDHATALRTMSRIAARRPDAQLVLVGDGPERGTIESLAKELKIESHVRLLGTRDDVPRIIAAADVALLTSVSEGIPLTLIEAMAAGVPVVATRVGGVPEVIEDGRTGLLAESGDDATLAELVLKLADDCARRAEFARLGRERATALFSEARMHDEYVQLFQRMLDV